MNRALFSGAVVSQALFGISWVSGGERLYQYYSLGNFGCVEYTEAKDIDNRGRVVGYSETAIDDCDTHAFLWTNGILGDLDDGYEKGVFHSATGISENGVVTGSGSPERVLVWNDGEIRPMEIPVECDNNGSPHAINDSGTLAAGYCYPPTFYFNPVLYNVADGSTTVLGFLPDSPPEAHGEAEDVNDHGVVVGRSYWLEYARSFIWSDGVMSEIVNTVGGEDVTAFGINNAGMVVGDAETTDNYLAMSYDSKTGIMTTLGPGIAYDVNARGAAVGRDIIDLIDVHPMLYQDGEVIDLNPFLPQPWTAARAYGINDYGWVVGMGDDAQGNTQGWLLVPIYPKGDYDGDEDVDLHDFGHFQECFAAEPYQGPEGGLHVGCSVFDFDDDIDLDLTDYQAFQAAFTGAITSGW